MLGLLIITIGVFVGPFVIYLMYRIRLHLEAPLCPYCLQLAGWRKGIYICISCGRKAERNSVYDQWFIRRDQKRRMKDTDLEIKALKPDDPKK